MSFRPGKLLKRTVRSLLHAAVGVFFTLIIVYAVYLNNREDLDVWHLAELDQEFTADSEVADFDGYLALEERLFAQLDELVYSKTETVEGKSINRYQRGSLSDPQSVTPDWNRSFIMPSDTGGASVLLIHGMSDSPYSLRSLAQRLGSQGAYVLGLRVPGHGTAPSGLVTTRLEDMAAAVRLAVRHLAEHNRAQPIYIVGYSHGAALAVDYTLQTLDQSGLPEVSGLVLISPEIGVTPVAALAIWQARLGWLLGLEKLAWNEIVPEYDPYKYGSFAVNAADVSHRVTVKIQKRITALTESEEIDNMPPVLAFSSVVDATVLAPALVEHLFNRLPPGGHHLILFDINRMDGLEPLLKWSPDSMINALKQNPHPSFILSLLTNGDNPGNHVEVHQFAPGQDRGTIEKLSLTWPVNVYSLTHVALPFPPGDPVYGATPGNGGPGIHLGDVAMKGERGVLKVSPAELLRLRWNPFYAYLEREVLEFIGLQSIEE